MRDPGLDLAIRAAGGVTALARELGLAQPSVSNWSRIPAERVAAVEAITGIDRAELRPDLYVQTMTEAVDDIDVARAQEYALLATLLVRAPDAALLAQLATLRGESLRLGRKGLLPAAFLGFTQFCINFNAVYLAERHITSGVVATVFALLLIPSSLLGWALLGHRPTARFVWSSVVAVSGIALLFVHELREHAASAKQIFSGIGLTLFGMIGASVAGFEVSGVITAYTRLKNAFSEKTVDEATAKAEAAKSLTAAKAAHKDLKKAAELLR